MTGFPGRSGAMVTQTLRLGGQSLELRATRRAARALIERAVPLDVEMELYFSCFLRKRVHFRDVGRDDVAVRAPLAGRVSVSFRPVMTRACRVADAGDAPDLEAVALARTTPFTPKWLALDYAKGRWNGTFGY
jgi:hypothetical protein